jgi:hypothetical protein
MHDSCPSAIGRNSRQRATLKVNRVRASKATTTVLPRQRVNGIVRVAKTTVSPEVRCYLTRICCAIIPSAAQAGREKVPHCFRSVDQVSALDRVHCCIQEGGVAHRVWGHSVIRRAFIMPNAYSECEWLSWREWIPLVRAST